VGFDGSLMSMAHRDVRRRSLSRGSDACRPDAATLPSVLKRERGKTSHERQRTSHIPLGERDRRVDAAAAERCGHGVLARLVTDERAVVFHQPVAGREAPRRREAGDRLAPASFA
jgi:hypothetical protein